MSEKTSCIWIEKWKEKTRFLNMIFLALESLMKIICEQSIDKKPLNPVENWRRK